MADFEESSFFGEEKSSIRDLSSNLKPKLFSPMNNSSILLS